MFTLYIGNNDSSVAEHAQQESTDAYLIDQNNFNIKHQGVAYTSLADLDTELELSRLFDQADIIVYSPPDNDQWSDGSGNKSIQKQIVEHYLTVFSFIKTKKIVNFELNKPDNSFIVDTVDVRQTESPQLWCAGCSITQGVGVTKKQRFANLLSNKLELPVSTLAQASTSIAWSADQILKSDIRSGDVLVWGITSPTRYMYYDKRVNHNQQKELDDNSLFQAVNQILQVVNICRTRNIKLVLAGLITGNELALYLTDLKEYIHLDGHFGLSIDNRFIDTGTDPLKHPGPKMHQWYADNIYYKLAKTVD